MINNFHRQNSKLSGHSNQRQLTKQYSERKFIINAHLNELSTNGCQTVRNTKSTKLPPIKLQDKSNSRENSPQSSNSGGMLIEKIEVFKLPDIDEKFFVKKSKFGKNNDSNLIKKAHSHQVSRVETEFSGSDRQIESKYLQRKVDFLQDVLVYDYVNQTYNTKNIQENMKTPNKVLRRQQTKHISENLTQTSPTHQRTKTQTNNMKINIKSQFFGSAQHICSPKQFIIEKLEEQI